MENIYERLLPVCSFAIGVYFPSIVNGAADWLERLRPGKKLQAVHETLNVIATHMEKLPSSSSLTDLTGQVEKLERVISERFSARPDCLTHLFTPPQNMADKLMNGRE